ncbi:MAG TPA: dienelactone hydrolase family protein [Ktedonobacterales bacterium]
MMEVSSLRSSILTHLGTFPPRVPLRPRFGAAIDEGAYARARVTYAVEPGERAPAWLLTPRGAAPPGGWPALVAVHQHANQYDLGKSEPASLAGDPMYHYGRELCQRGYVVLCPDLLCFEERRPAREARAARKPLEGAENERFEFTKRVLSGSCLQTKYLHDLTCAVDLLASLPSVNRERLGVIGHSLGGLEALWLSWYDPRIRVAVSSCGFGLLRTLVRDAINHGFATYVPGLLNVCDLDMVAAAVAPRAFMLTAGESDLLFPIDGVRDIVATARRQYAAAGAPEGFEAILFQGGHSFPDDVKAEAYAFLDRWLRR